MSGGRKPLGDPKDGLAPFIGFRVPRETAEAMDRYVKAIGRTRSEFLRDAIDQALKRAMDEEVAQAS